MTLHCRSFNLVFMWVMNVVNDKLICLDHAWVQLTNPLSHFGDFVSA